MQPSSRLCSSHQFSPTNRRAVVTHPKGVCASESVTKLCPTLLSPTRLFCPGVLPVKNIGVGCRFLLQGILSTQGSNLCLESPALAGGFTTSAVCAKSLQSCLTLCDPLDCSPPVSSVHGILQARILEWVAMPSSRGSS